MVDSSSRRPGDRAHATPAGWYPDPNTGQQRYWDGQRWLPPGQVPRPVRSSSFWDDLRRAPTWVKIGAGLLALIVVAGLIGGPDEDSDESGGSSQQGPFHASPAAIEDLVNDEVDGDPEPQVTCAGPSHCEITYEIEELLGLDTELELLEEQRAVWQTLFTDAKLDSAVITLRAPVTTVGGKRHIDEVLTVSCNRRAADRIAWNRVDPDGVKALCNWVQLVGD